MSLAIEVPVFGVETEARLLTEFHRANHRLVEVGRLIVGRRYRRRRNDVVCGADHLSKPDHITDSRQGERRTAGTDAFMTVLKALYHATRRIGATHWLTAMEEPLRHQLAEQGFPFRAFGPETEYYGRIVPYQMALNDLAAAILSGRFPGLDAFATVHEPDRLPHAAKASRDAV